MITQENEVLQKLSHELMFPDVSEKFKADKWIENFKSRNENMGFIDRLTEDDQPLFTHFTYAEYFCACYLKNKVQTDNKVKIFEIVECILQNEVPVFASCISSLFSLNYNNEEMLNTIFENTCALNFVAKHGLVNCVQCFINEDSWRENINSDKTFIHYAAENRRLDVIIFILMCIFDFFKDEEQISVIPLFYVSKFMEFLEAKNKIIKNDQHDVITTLFKELMSAANDGIKPNPEKNVLHMLNAHESGKNFATFIIGYKFDPNMDIFWEFLSNLPFQVIQGALDNKDEQCFDPWGIESLIEYVLEKDNYDAKDILTFIKWIYEKFTTQQETLGEKILKCAIENDFLNVFKHFYMLKNNFQEQPVEFYNKVFDDCFKNACKANAFNCVKFLLLNTTERKKTQALRIALETKSNMTILKYICENTHPTTEEYNASLFLTNGICQLQQIQYFIEKGANVHAINGKNETLFDYLIQQENDEFLPWCLDNCVTPRDSPYITTLKEYCSDPLSFNIRNANDLCNAIKNNDIKMAEFLLKKGADINLRDENGNTLLYCACEQSWDMVVLLLCNGAQYDEIQNENINEEINRLLYIIEDCFNKRSLHFLKEPNQALIPLIVNVTNKEKETLWHVVLKHESPENVKKLFLPAIFNKISEKAMNSQDNDGNSILHLAAQHGYEDMVTNMIVSGAYFNLQNNKGQTPEMLAKNQKHEKIKNFLRCVHELFENLDRINEEKYNFISMSPFVAPVFKSNLIQACDSDGKNLLHHAVENQKIEVAKTLLNVNRQLSNKKDKIGRTPLFYAIKNDYLEMMDLLLKKGAKAELWKYTNNCTNRCSNFINKVNKLFNMAKEGNVTSLKNELQNENFELDLITGVNMRNHKNLSLIKIAEDTVNFELVKLLLTKGGMVWSHKDIYNKKFEKLYSFINKIFECVESKKYTSLSIIRQIEKNNCTDMMINVRYNDLEGDTLLHIAAKADDAVIFEWLLKNGAKIDLKNFDGQTASDLAGKDSKVLTIIQERTQ